MYLKLLFSVLAFLLSCRGPATHEVKDHDCTPRSLSLSPSPMDYRRPPPPRNDDSMRNRSPANVLEMKATKLKPKSVSMQEKGRDTLLSMYPVSPRHGHGCSSSCSAKVPPSPFILVHPSSPFTSIWPPPPQESTGHPGYPYIYIYTYGYVWRCARVPWKIQGEERPLPCPPGA